MKQVWDDRKMEVCGEQVILAYLVIMGETREVVINTTSKLLRPSKTLGLCVNEEQTKYLMVTRKNSATDNIIVVIIGSGMLRYLNT